MLCIRACVCVNLRVLEVACVFLCLSESAIVRACVCESVRACVCVCVIVCVRVCA